MLNTPEMRHLQAVIVLAEELNFTRAARILRIGQPASVNRSPKLRVCTACSSSRGKRDGSWNLPKPVERLSKRLAPHFSMPRGYRSSSRCSRGCRECLADRTFALCRPCVDLGSLRNSLAALSKLRVRLVTRSAMELARGASGGELNLALVTAPPLDAQTTRVPFARAPLHVALPETHPSAHKEQIALRDLASDEWIMLARNVHPIIHDAILQTAQLERIAPKDAHDVMTAHQAVHLVSEHVGVAILSSLEIFGVKKKV